jgi:hypothetical protein
MKRLGLIVALVIVALAGWLGWTYTQTDHEVRDLNSRLPSEQDLDRMPLEETTEQLKLASIDCTRVATLQASTIARLFKGSEIDALAGQCDLIRARRDSLEGP